jgi:1-deoxy-D-xylulose-5-phosphate synthase
VGNDGATHHGLLDLAYLRPIPNMVIGAPMTGEDLEQMLVLAKDYDGPIAIRYPRGRVSEGDEAIRRLGDRRLAIGKGVCLREGSKVAVLSIGAIGNTVAEAIGLLGERLEASVAHYDMRWLKPLDEDILAEVAEKFPIVVTAEDGMINGGLGSAVAEYMAAYQMKGERREVKRRVIRLGVDDQFVEHGSTKELYQLLKLDKEGICESLLQVLEQ